MNKAVRVGVGVIILRNNKILLGERIGSHGANTWATPGGHLEMGEDVEACARREVLEETGLVLDEIKKLGFTNDIFEQEDKHYVTLFVVAKSDSGEAEIKEPNKCKQWQWRGINELPEPLFLPLVNLLKESPEFVALADKVMGETVA
ncbi:NUDIX hydrolase [Thalassomonas sp. RHCl1]|uniref:nucleotide triphosphate diphosphatase NUDT15 n=1 Tax=Thalassomonas sp. RHCl1 TaxID=2995320 RepID=UPI00248BA72E|nr:NUDIX hydrolase [Thalassomonas sp. RHCl1]